MSFIFISLLSHHMKHTLDISSFLFPVLQLKDWKEEGDITLVKMIDPLSVCLVMPLIYLHLSQSI
jgi:hypothetical protein